MYMEDILYYALLFMALVSMIASANVKWTFNRYAKKLSATGMTGEMAARRILQMAGIGDVIVRPIKGTLSDHYNPSTKELCLSEEVFYGASVSSIGVAAHECGHAIQHQQEYAPLKIRSMLVPAANLGSKLGIPLVFLGFLLGEITVLVDIGILIFSFSVLFHLVTLPVEFNASQRAVELCDSYGILAQGESKECKKVLWAAAMTYLAAAAISVLQLLRLMAIRGRRN